MPASEDFTPLDTLKRYLSAPRRMIGEGLSSLATLPQRVFQASEQMRTEGPYDPAPAVEAALLPMGTGAIAGAPVRAGEKALGAGPIRAYHSSPHDFDKFDLAKIGTGEGAQVYGHGLYFAENPAVSGQGGKYWNQFLRRFPEQEQITAGLLQGNQFNREATASALQRQITELQGRLSPGGVFDKPHLAKTQERTRNFIDELSAQRDQLLGGKPVGPRTYEVDIKADPAHMLDWDKRFSQQSPFVQEAMDRQLSKQWPKLDLPQRDPSGEWMYQAAAGPQKNRSAGYPASSAALGEAGIPGIKYLDEGSRGLPSADQFRVSQPYTDLGTNWYGGGGNKGWYVQPRPGNNAFKEYGPFKTEAEANALRASEPWKTRNYVVRDPTILDIVKKYGLAGLAAPPAIAGAMRDRE